ncbi:hypothetical protein MPSI1_001942 [Malassezia psittaci]|uniref:BHLH domain-containing protein n=1 Tax=Malassezia psittaci TaxID=1821823 RepID=A0AAF0F585_9BASI|nr:hypothetical protein MPSI1_001942 [Malassezia psittaci]
MEAMPTTSSNESGKTWLDRGGVPASPKFWAQVELPDMFLSNLFHKAESDFVDDSFTEFSGSATTGSESCESPEAFQDFMLGHSSASSPLHIESHESPNAPIALPQEHPLVFKDHAPLNDMLDTWVLPNQNDPPTNLGNSNLISVDPSFRPVFPVSQPEPLPTTGSDSQSSIFTQTNPAASTAFQHPGNVQGEPLQATPAAYDSQDTSSSAQSGLLQMPTGSNPTAMTALARIREYSKQLQSDPTQLNLPIDPSADSMQRSKPTDRKSSSTSFPLELNAQSKKVAHNAIERRYRSNINDRIAGLRDVVPALREMRPRDGTRRRRRNKKEDQELVDGVAAATKLSKATVLSKATEYICYLKSREVQLDREVNALHMLIRSLEGGDELLAAWNQEMKRVEQMQPNTNAAMPNFVHGQPAVFADEDDDDDDDENESEDKSSTDSEFHRRKMPRYMLGAFVGFSFLGRASDWPDQSSTYAIAPSHTRVINAGHQLLKRSGVRSSSPSAVHAWDSVPMHQLVLELLRTLTLTLLVVTLMIALYTRYQRKRKQETTHRSNQLQDICSAAKLFQSPVEQALDHTDVHPEEARERYAALTRAIPAFASSSLWWTLAKEACLASILAHVPVLDRLVAACILHAYDPTVLHLEKQACLQRLQIELALGDEIQPCNRQRWLTLAVYQTHLLIAPHSQEERVILALGYGALAASMTKSAWLKDQAAQLWNEARAEFIATASLQSTPTSIHPGVKLSDSVPTNRQSIEQSKKQEILRDVLSIPLDLAISYATTATSRMPSAAENQSVPVNSSELECKVCLSPILNILDALRNEELAAFWTSLLDSLMRGDTQKPSKESPVLQPHVLDIVKDKASLLRLRKNLGQMARLRPWRNVVAIQQLNVAIGTLALISGNIPFAKQHASSLAAHKMHCRAAYAFYALVMDKPTRSMPCCGPVDGLAAIVLEWMHLQRDSRRTLPDSKSAAKAVSESVLELQSLASQCVWESLNHQISGNPQRKSAASLLDQVQTCIKEMWAAPAVELTPAMKLAQRQWRHDENLLDSKDPSCLTHSLDTLLDRLGCLVDSQL